MLSALYKKTIMRILKSTICATNLLIGCVLAVLLAVAMVISGPEKVMRSLEISDSMQIVKGAACYVVAAMVCMTNTAAVSLALEGKNIWLIKSLPISPKILYDSYLLTNLTFTVPTSIVCSVLFSISLKTGFIGTALMILTPLTFSLFTAAAGIFIGNRMAYYDWQDETQLIKQSMMSLIGILGGLALIAICGVIANIGILPMTANMITFILDVLFLVLTAVIYINESKRPIKE
jgi:ABC-2 type transport system permease protein